MTQGVSSPLPIYLGLDGEPLQNGRLYFGGVGLNPETNPVPVHWDAALTQQAAQPVRTINGMPSRNGTPAILFVDSAHSLTIRDSAGRLVLYARDSLEYSGLAQLKADLASTAAGKGAALIGFDFPVNYVKGTVGRALKDGIPNVALRLTAAEQADVDSGAYALNVLPKIQAAIDAVATLTGGRGGMVVMPPGRYAISGGSVVLRTGTVLEMCGSTIRQLTSNTPIITVDSAVEMQRWGVQNGILEFATQQTAVQTSGVGIQVSNTKNSYNWWVRNVQVSFACDGMLAPETTGSFAFACVIENFTAAQAARWAINFSCDAVNGANTNVDVRNAWALQLVGSEIAGSKGFRFLGCVASRFHAVYADHIQSTFCEFTSCEGLWGDLTAESCDFVQSSAGPLNVMSFSDCVGDRRELKFIANTFTASGGGEIYMVRDTTSSGTRRLDVDLFVSENNTYSGGASIYEMVPSAGMRIFNSEARLDRTVSLLDFTAASPRIWTWNGYRRWARGNTASRPTLNAADIGYLYMDDTLDSDGQTIWWNGTAWVNSTGTVV